MRSCPKCGSYLPEGKVFCVSCGRPNIAVSKNSVQRTQSEKRQTYARIRDSKMKSEQGFGGFLKNNHPYQGNTYEQHKSHDPRSKDYYKMKYEKGDTVLPEGSQRIICAAAYFGVFFFLPLILLPNSREGKFHANQGLVLFVFNIICSLFGSILSSVFGAFFEIVAVLPPILMVYGAANAYRGNMTELPFIGKIRLIGDNFDKWR